MAVVHLEPDFYDHPKLAQLPARQMLSAVGLYTLTLCWSVKHMTDGHIPQKQVISLLGKKINSIETALIECGLWHKVSDGFLIHDYADYNPTRVQMQAERDAAKKRMQRVRANKGRTNGEHVALVRANISEQGANVRSVDRDDGKGEEEKEDSPVPPSLSLHPLLSPISPFREKEEEAAILFDSFWKLYPRKIGRGQARRAWSGAVKKVTVEVIIAGLERQLPHWAQKERDFVPYPSTWLNGERWSDELEPALGAKVQDPRVREARISKARKQLAAGAEEWVVRGMVNDDEWEEVMGSMREAT